MWKYPWAGQAGTLHGSCCHQRINVLMGEWEAAVKSFTVDPKGRCSLEAGHCVFSPHWLICCDAKVLLSFCIVFTWAPHEFCHLPCVGLGWTFISKLKILCFWSSFHLGRVVRAAVPAVIAKLPFPSSTNSDPKALPGQGIDIISHRVLSLLSFTQVLILPDGFPFHLVGGSVGGQTEGGNWELLRWVVDSCSPS